MQCMSADGFGTASIERIPCQRMADIRHVYPNLMGTPGSGRAGKQTVLPSGCKNRVLCQTVFALRRHTTTDNGIASSADWRFDLSRAQRQGPLHNRKIAFLH